MSKLTKLNLGLGMIFSIVGTLFNVDLINTGDIPPCYIALPLGEVFLGMFAICYMLGNEAARFDAEHAGRH